MAVTDLATEKDVPAIRRFQRAYFSSTTLPSLMAIRPVTRLSVMKASRVDVFEPTFALGIDLGRGEGQLADLVAFLDGGDWLSKLMLG